MFWPQCDKHTQTYDDGIYCASIVSCDKNHHNHISGTYLLPDCCNCNLALKPQSCQRLTTMNSGRKKLQQQQQQLHQRWQQQRNGDDNDDGEDNNNNHLILRVFHNLSAYDGHLLLQFLPRYGMLTTVYPIVMCPSVCVSVTLHYCMKTAKRRIMQIMPYDSPLTLIFLYQSSRRNSNEIIPYWGDKCRWGGLKFATFDAKCAITGKRYTIDA